jgi:putative transposase
MERSLPPRSCYQTLVVKGSVSNAQADQAAQELGVSRSLVYRLVARYRQRAQTSSLLSVPRGRTEQTQWLDKEVETLIRSAVERIYLQREQPRVSDLFRAIKADCQRFGLKPPSYNTVHARLLSLDPKEVTRRRIGAAAAATLYAGWDFFAAADPTFGSCADRPHSGRRARR